MPLVIDSFSEPQLDPGADAPLRPGLLRVRSLEALDRTVAGLSGGVPRPQQAEMCEAVAGVFAERESALVVNAGTGTGKTLAYLVPAVVARRRVIVATATKALQDQIIRHDVPMLADGVGRTVTAVTLKGRSNYLCAQKIKDLRTRLDEGTLDGFDDGSGLPEDTARLLDWERTDTINGDQAELTFEPSAAAWAAVSSSSDECPGQQNCPSGETCFYEKQREAAEKADVVIVNHHLYLHLASRDAAPVNDRGGHRGGGQRRPVIIDEAHEFADTATQVLGTSVTQQRYAAIPKRLSTITGLNDVQVDEDLVKNVDEAGDSLFGLLAEHADELLPRPLPYSLRFAVSVAIIALQKAGESLGVMLQTALLEQIDREEAKDAEFDGLSVTDINADIETDVAADNEIDSEANIETDVEVNIEAGVETDVQADAEVISEADTEASQEAQSASDTGSSSSDKPETQIVVNGHNTPQDLKQDKQDAQHSSTDDDDELEIKIRQMERLQTSIVSLIKDLTDMSLAEEDTASWVETMSQRGSTNKHSQHDTNGQYPKVQWRTAPLEIGDMLNEFIWRDRTSVLTSATIPPGYARRVGIETANQIVEVDSINVGSPFHYTNHLLYCPKHMPRPGQPGYDDAVHNEMVTLIEAAEGRTLALFTSWSALDKAADHLRDRLLYPILTQRDYPKPELIRRFTEDPHTCLLGTLGLWQGIDVPGESCQLVIITRLPFPHPNNPLHKARRENAPSNAFREIDVPATATRLAQGVGRLIRTETDQGAVAVLDSRLATAQYRKLLLDTIPPFKRTINQNDIITHLKQLRNNNNRLSF